MSKEVFTWTVSSIMDTFITAVGGRGMVRGDTGMVPEGTPVSMLVTCAGLGIGLGLGVGSGLGSVLGVGVGVGVGVGLGRRELLTCLSWVTPSSHLQMFFGQLLRPAQAVTHLVGVRVRVRGRGRGRGRGRVGGRVEVRDRVRVR